MPSTYKGYCDLCPYSVGKHLEPAERAVRCMPIPLESNGSKVLLVFQSPGMDEWKNGRPISSTSPRSAAMKVASALHLRGATRRDFDIANVVQCFPRKAEKSGTKAPRDLSPKGAAVGACSQWLQEDIARGSYERVIVFGSHAKRALFRLGYDNDSRFNFVPHPSASGVSVQQLADYLT